MKENLPYEIGEFVYHDTPGGPRGKILDIKINLDHGIVSYLFCMGPGSVIWVETDELTRDKQPE